MNVRSTNRTRRTVTLSFLFVLAASFAPAQFTWDGTTTFASVVGSNTLASGSTLAITTTNDHDFNGTALVINGTVNWTAGNLRSGNNGSITNNAAWNDASTNHQFNADYGGAFSFTNSSSGTYTKSAAGQTNFYVPFNNAGALVLTTGTFNLQGGGAFSGTGSVSAGSGTTLFFNSNYTIPDASKLTGTGNYVLLSGALDLSGVLGAAGFKLQSGQLTNSQTFNSTVPWTGTDLNTAGTTTIGTSGVFTISTAADHNFSSRAIVNNGTVSWTGGNLRSGNGGSIINNGAWNDASTDQQFNAAYGGAFSFTNSASGTYTKSATGQTNFFVPFNNDGALALTTGTLNLQGGGTFSGSGSATVASGATLLFNSNYAIANGASLLGAGSYQLVSNTLTMTGTVSVNNFVLASGQLAGTQTFAGGVNWTGTDLNTPGTTTNSAGSTLMISSAADHNFSGRTIVNNGTVNWIAGNLRSGNNGVITNNAAWNDTSTDQQFNAAYGGAFSFTNSASGTYTKSAAGQTNFYVPLNNAGALVLTTGTFNLQGGGAFSGTGSVSAGSGTTLFFNSNYTIPDASKLTGTGNYVLLSGALDLSGVLGAAGFKLQSGQLTNSQTFNNTVPWTGADLNTAGTTTIGTSGVFTISTAADHNFNTRALVNNGTVNWTGGNLRSGNGGSIINNAAWNDASTDQQFNAAYGGAFSFTNSASGTYTKSAAGQTNFYIPFNNTGALVLSSGSLNLQGGGSFSSTATATVATGTTLFFNSNYSIANGVSLLGGGTYHLFSSTLTMSGTVSVNNFVLASGQLAGTQTFAGGVNWTGTDLNTPGTTTNSAGSTLTISTAADHNLNTRAIVNDGTVNWTAGNLRSGSGGSIINNAAWNDASTDQQFNAAYGGAFSFTNSASGTYTKSAAGQTSFFVPFNNSGNVNVQSGTLAIAGGGTLSSSGVITAAAGANVIFSNSYTLANASSLAGAGSFSLTAGTLSATGTVNVSNFTIAGGTLAGSQTFAGGLIWTGGNFNSAATTTIASGSSFTISGNIDHDFNAHSFINNGTTTWSATGGNLRSGNNGSITNNALFVDAGTSTLVYNNAYGGTAASFVNAAGGTYRKTGAGTTDFSVPFTNDGTIDVQAGTVRLLADGTFNGGSTMTGTGALQFASGLLTANGTMTFSNFQFVGGTITGTHTFNGMTTWLGGNFNSAGTTTIGGTLVIDSTADHDFNAHTFSNNGTVNWLAGAGRLRSGNNGQFVNNATFNDAAGNVFNNDYGGTASQFTNTATGTYNKTSAGTTTFSNVGFVNAGTINAQAGMLDFAGGGSSPTGALFNVSNGATLRFTSGGFAVADGSGFTGPGTFAIAGATVTLGGTVSATNLQLLSGTLAGTHTLTGGLTWTGGNMNAGGTTTIGAGGTLIISSAADHDFNAHAIVNQGSVNWTGGQLRSGNAGAFTNSGVFNDTASSNVNNAYGGTTLTFTNTSTGTYNKTAAGQTTFLVPYHNAGTVNVTGGPLSLNAGGTIGNGAAYTGSGQALLASGTFTATGNLTSSSLVVAGATLAGNFTLASGTLTFTGGTLNDSSTATIGSGSTLLHASPANFDYNFRAIVNDGTFNWSAGAGQLRSGNGGTLTNNALFLDAASNSVNNAYGGTVSQFFNSASGTYSKTAAGSTTFAVPFNNAGTVTVGTGSLVLTAGGTISSGAIFNGAGLTILESGTFTANGMFTSTNLVLGGSANLTGNVSLAGMVTWTSGNFNNGSTTTVPNGATFAINTLADHDYNGHALVNNGVVNWNAGQLRSGNSGSIINAGVWNDLASSNVNNAYGGTLSTFTNNGTYNKAAAGTTTFSIPVTNTGTMNVTAGTLVFSSTFTNSGALALANGASLQVSGAFAMGTAPLSGTGTITAPGVTAGGLVSPGTSPGTLTLTGNLTLLATSTLLIELGGMTQGTGYDFLNVGGSAVLAGGLSLTFTNGFQSTVLPGNTFTVMTGTAGLTGTFANIGNGQRLTTLDGAGSFQVNFGVGSAFASNSVVLSNFVAIPEPSTYALLGLGALAVVWTVRRRRTGPNGVMRTGAGRLAVVWTVRRRRTRAAGLK